MKKICIYYFSGTGMTKHVVNKLLREFEKNEILADCFQMEEFQISKVKLSNYDLFGIAYPVHAFNAPKIVIDFASQLPKSNGIDTFIIGSMGENNIVNFASSNTLIKKLKNKGYNVFYNRIFEMPCNFIIKYEPSKVKLILDNINKDIPHTAKEIISLTAHQMRGGPIPKFLSFIGKAEWFGARIMSKFFYANTDCTQCGRCIKNCPSHNIIKSGKSVRFKWNCSLCMRCIYQCPAKAISIHQPFKFIRIDGWYDSNDFDL